MARRTEFTQQIKDPLDFRVGRTYEVRHKTFEELPRILNPDAHLRKYGHRKTADLEPDYITIHAIDAEDLKKDEFVLHGYNDGVKKTFTIDPELLLFGYAYENLYGTESSDRFYFFGKPEYDNKESEFRKFMELGLPDDQIYEILAEDVEDVLNDGGTSLFWEGDPTFATTTTRSPQSYGKQQNDDTISASGIGSSSTTTTIPSSTTTTVTSSRTPSSTTTTNIRPSSTTTTNIRPSSTTTTTRSPQSYGREQNDDTISASGTGSSSTDDLLTKPAEVPPSPPPPKASTVPPPKASTVPPPKASTVPRDVTSADIAYGLSRLFKRGPAQVPKNGGKRHGGRKSKKLTKNKRRVTRRKQFT